MLRGSLSRSAVIRPVTTVAVFLVALRVTFWVNAALVAEVEGLPMQDFAVPMPVVVSLDAQGNPAGRAKTNRWEVIDISTAAAPLPAQYEANPSGPAGRLWWLCPPGLRAAKRYQLRTSAEGSHSAMRVISDPDRGLYDITENGQPVLRYNHGTVPVPPGIPTNFARGDYIMPLYGLDGEILAADYPKDHPHHRGLGWSWPVTRWGKEVRDIWAVSGVWARPVAVREMEAGPVFALLRSESVWKWGDTTPVVREEVAIRAFRQANGHRLVDIEIRLWALADDVAIGGRPHGGYGGFGLRAQPATQRTITRFVDPETANFRRSWLDYSGLFEGAKAPSGLAIFEHPANLFYPNTLLEYPDLNYVMPAFPGEREVLLSRQQPLVLRHRVWIHRGMAKTDALHAVCRAYHQPVETTLRTVQ
jgi:hypothetical protein